MTPRTFYTCIPDSFLLDFKQFTPTEHALMILILTTQAKSLGFVEAKPEEWIFILGCDPRTFEKSISSLIAKGLIKAIKIMSAYRAPDQQIPRLGYSILGFIDRYAAQSCFKLKPSRALIIQTDDTASIEALAPTIAPTIEPKSEPFLFQPQTPIAPQAPIEVSVSSPVVVSAQPQTTMAPTIAPVIAKKEPEDKYRQLSDLEFNEIMTKANRIAKALP